MPAIVPSAEGLRHDTLRARAPAGHPCRWPAHRHAGGLVREPGQQLVHTLRGAIDAYTVDKQKAPQTLQDLSTERYLQDVPKDPITGKNDSWKIIMEDAGQAVSQSEPGIFDVRSSSDRIGLDGTPYSEW